VRAFERVQQGLGAGVGETAVDHPKALPRRELQHLRAVRIRATTGDKQKAGDPLA
jgi:hypothetical protein